MRAQNDNAETGGGPFAPSTIALLLPAALIIAGYGILLATLVFLDMGNSAVARLCIVILALAAPFLVAYAVLRRVSTRLDVFSHAVHLQPGFPKAGQYVVPYALIRSVRVRRGIGGWLAGSGTVFIELTNGARIAASDLAAPESARDAILSRLHPAKPVELSAEEPEKPENLRVSSG